MRILLISIVSSLIAFLLWPWINNFFKFLKRRYDNVTTFDEVEVVEKETPTTKKETKDNDDT